MCLGLSLTAPLHGNPLTNDSLDLRIHPLKINTFSHKWPFHNDAGSGKNSHFLCFISICRRSERRVLGRVDAVSVHLVRHPHDEERLQRGHRRHEGQPHHASDDPVPAHVLRDQPDDGALDDGPDAAHAVHEAGDAGAIVGAVPLPDHHGDGASQERVWAAVGSSRQKQQGGAVQLAPGSNERNEAEGDCAPDEHVVDAQ